ncbi:MAG: hypothetical protein CM1200mP2_54820 [Planctomycetaceae bacterium]|nr:MAG: hypothetical protein CM1200mP2_54820 [Planctomycetaceae bacterium]
MRGPFPDGRPVPLTETRPAITPADGVLRLFNGRNLQGLSTWLRDSRNKDPRKVFTVHDGLLHISGNGFGYIRTNKDYRDYHLVVEFKWGPRTWGSRKDRSRDSGVLVHAAGPDGSGGGPGWPRSRARLSRGDVEISSSLAASMPTENRFLRQSPAM